MGSEFPASEPTQPLTHEALKLLRKYPSGLSLDDEPDERCGVPVVPKRLRGAVAYCEQQRPRWARVFGIAGKAYVQITAAGMHRLELDALHGRPLEMVDSRTRDSIKAPAKKQGSDKAQGGRPRNARLNRIIIENPKATTRDIKSVFKRVYSKPIAEGKVEVPSNESIRTAKSRLKKAGALG